MKKITFVFILMLGIILLTVCNKEYYNETNKYPIPDNKRIDNPNIVGKQVTVEWETSYGLNDSTNTIVAYYKGLGRNVILFEVHNPYVNIFMRYDTANRVYHVFALKPITDGMVWNWNNGAPIGVYENNTHVIITTNNMRSPVDNNTMCMRLTISK